MRTLPALVHVRAGAREGDRPVDEVSARTMNVDALRRDLQGGALPRDTEVLFTGISDWTPAHAIPELWVAGPAQTIVEDEEPASSVGESSRRSVAPDAGRRRKSFGALAWVGAVFGALALLATGLGAVYLVYFHYKPVAVQHLPRKCTVAVRVDLVDTYRFDPAKNGLPPLVNSLLRGPPKPPPPGPQPPEPPPLAERLKVQAGIDLGMGHVREVAVCVYQDHKAPSKDPFLGFRAVIAVGGKIKGGVVPGLFEALRTEGSLAPAGLRLDGVGPTAVIRGKLAGVDFVVGQADDGTLLFAFSDEALASARELRPEEDAKASTGLLNEGAIEVSASHYPFGLLGLVTPPKELMTVLPRLAKIQNGHLALHFGKAPRAVLTVEPDKASEAKSIEEAVKELLEVVQTELTKMPRDWIGEHGAVGGAHLSREDLRITLRLDFRLSDLDRGTKELAAQVDDPKSPWNTSTLPKLGLAPSPSASASASASGSASGAPSLPPSVSPSLVPPTEGDD